MPRDPGRPREYAPLLEFYVRQDVEGGSVREPGLLRGTLDAQARDSCLILVHGFNNTDGQAAQAYFGFRQRQAKLDRARAYTFEKYFADAFWPGDADLPWLLDLLDFGVYPIALRRAERAAVRIVDLLMTMPNLRAVDFVAHSLGCRVVLESLLILSEKLPMFRVARVCLMAAAVPSEMLEPGGRFHDLLVRLQADGTKLFVLHSSRDAVLSYAFYNGQALAGEPSVRPLGSYGPSEFMPGYNSTLKHCAVPRAGHSDYWGHKTSRASGTAIAKAGDFLGLKGLARQVGEGRSTGDSIDPLEARRLGTMRAAFGRVAGISRRLW